MLIYKICNKLEIAIYECNLIDNFYLVIKHL